MLYISHLFNGYVTSLNGLTDEEGRLDRVKEVKKMVQSFK